MTSIPATIHGTHWTWPQRWMPAKRFVLSHPVVKALNTATMGAKCGLGTMALRQLRKFLVFSAIVMWHLRQ